MNREEIFTEVQNIFRDIFDNKNLLIFDTTNSSHIEDWDSLNHINLISAIEKEFNIKFTLGEISELQDVGAMINVMIKKLNTSNE